MQNIAQRPGKKQNETDTKVHKLDSHLTKELHIRVQTRILFCRRKAAAHSQLTNKNSYIYLHTINKVPNYNEKLRSSVTVQEFFFASFEFSPSEFKRSNASTSTDYIWSRPVHCSRAPRCTDSDCHYHSLTS